MILGIWRRIDLPRDPLSFATLTMQVQPMQPPQPAKEERDSWWATEEDRNAWIEFLEANKVRPSDPWGLPSHGRGHRR